MYFLQRFSHSRTRTGSGRLEVPPPECGFTESSTAAAQSASAGFREALKGFLRVLDQNTGVVRPVKEVADELIRCVEIYESAAKGRDEFKALQGELEVLLGDLEKHFSRSPTITASMESLCKSILRELGYVKEKQGRSTVRRHLEAEEDLDDVLACYRRIQAHLQRLSLNANLSMWNIVDEQTTNAQLERLCPSLSARYNSRQATQLKRGACTPGTRIEVLGHAYSWTHNGAPGSVYWLNGMAGTGKTTIAYSLCAELDAAQKLGASFFCSRLLPECRDVNQIIPSIAYQLARFSRPFRSALSRVLDRDPDAHTQLLEIQFETLVIKPLMEAKATLPEDLVVIIDALDECDDKETTGQILEALLTKMAELPIKFFITSRPEPEIRDQMRRQGDYCDISRLVLHELDKGTVQGDIKTYLKAALQPIEPSESDITVLVQRADILFIYAATVVRYVGFNNFRRNPRSRLETILSISTSAETHVYKEIDELYGVILKASIDDPGLNDQEREDMKQVLYTVLCAREPLTIGAISGLNRLHDMERVHAALAPLWSVLHVVESSELVTTLHASFPDYMFDSKRSKGYSCDAAAQDQVLARSCFNCVRDTKPQFNVCGLESSYVLDDEISNLSARVKKAISLELRYACRHWATHLERAQESLDLVELLDEFLSARLLLWMEIMNLNKCMDVGVGVIWQAKEWCRLRALPADLSKLAHDAWRFVAAFASNPVSQSTPHIYVSMLPFWPRSRPVAKRYARRTQHTIVPQGSAVTQRSLALLATWLVDGDVKGVAWSPDGTRIALVAAGQASLLDAVTGRRANTSLQLMPKSVQSIGFSSDSTRLAYGAEDGTVGVWDVHSGHLVLGPLRGHTGSAASVAFSPGDIFIASGSDDTTVRIWDTRSGQMVLGPLEGHTRSVRSVAFSSDGTRIVSGSLDETARIWNTHSGELVLRPFEAHTNRVRSVAFSPNGTYAISGSDDNTIRKVGVYAGFLLKGHTGSVTSVAFSPDGKFIVSGSSDNTIRVWDAISERTVLGPLQGHTNQVTSVAFSPDGTRIVSGSYDKTICIWDAQTDHVKHGTRVAHTDSITSVAFSPDGTCIVSGSWDKTIYMWDIQSGEKKLGPLGGHTGFVTSVALSPDGTRIVSGSWDKTICIWSTQSERMLLGPLKGHAQAVTSVVFSPDGTRIASGSNDNAIHIWDARSGQLLLGPLRGHSLSVLSVAFSPDGTRIVSGSNDNTIRMWDAQSGQTVFSPLEGHTNSVRSVAFSPDGTHIISGSSDKTIRIWNAQSGQMVLGPLKGHTNWVRSVAFSPNGAHIVSGSNDTTVYVWDVHSGKAVLGPLKGHTNWVTSVAFSPDGTRVISGSYDRTIRVWDARCGQTTALSSSSSLAVSLSWKINPSGWAVDTDIGSRLLVWIPSDLRHVLLPPQNILRISANPSVGLNFTNVMIGESWTECYRPE